MKFKNLIQMIEQCAQKYQNPKALNFLQNKKWQSFSHEEFLLNVQKISLALKEMGLKPNKGFGILANPNPIWLMFNFAAISNKAISVPIFANISSSNLFFQIKDANIEYFFCDSKENLKILTQEKIKFKKIITFGFKSKNKNSDIIEFEELLQIGKKILKKDPNSYQKLVKNIKENDLATIIYTSGTTGFPKGVEITHKNLVSQIKGSDAFFPLKSDEDIALSFLPLAHIFEGMVMNFYIAKGISIYFVNDVKNIAQLLLEVKPTLMTVVPRMLEKTFNNMSEKLSQAPFIKRLIGNLAFKLALNTNPEKNKIPFYSLFNKLVYSKLFAGLGGNLKMMICGGAPLSKNLEQFFNNIGINLYVGYGLTESSPVIGANCPKNHKIGTIGKAFPNVKVKIKNGELLTKSSSVMKGYHNNKKQTDEVIDKNGWLKTGDLAKIDKNGFITITGRKKELFKTAGGKYVSPVPIEQKILQNCRFLTASLVIAEGRKCVSALLFFDIENLENHKKKFGLEKIKDKDFFNNELIQTKIKQAIKKTNTDLNQWEKIRNFKLIGDELTIENGDITPSMKLKRNNLEDKYHKIIENFYK